MASKLGVAHLLEGSVRKSGDLIRVSAELIDTVDGSTQWSERYDRPYKDLFALQDDITRAVAQALKTKLLPARARGGTKRAPPDREPRGLQRSSYRAEFYAFRFTEADLHKAIDFFQQATQTLTRAMRLRGVTYREAGPTSVPSYLEGAHAQEAYGKSREAADRALAARHQTLQMRIWLEAALLLRAEFRLAWSGSGVSPCAGALAPNVPLRPNSSSGSCSPPSVILSRRSILHEQAIDGEPLRAIWYNWLANYLLALNRRDEAERAIRKAIELQPGADGFYYLLSSIAVQRGDARAALSAAEQEHPGPWRDTSYAIAMQIGTDRSAADAALKTLIEKNGDVAPFQIAQVYALRNDPKATFEWLERALSSRDPGVQGLLYDPSILRFRADPRFAAFCRKVGLPAP